MTAQQWLAELMCERRARHEHKALPLQFWKVKPWDAVYRQQVAAVSRLINRLDPEKSGTAAKAISLFLRSERGKTVYSLMGAWILPYIEKQHSALLAELDRRQTEPQPAPAGERRPPEPPRPALVRRPSLITKLKGLE